MAQTPEGRVKAKIKLALAAKGIWHFLPVSNGMGTHGVPDVICCCPILVTPDMVGQRIGAFLAVEAKAPGKRNNTSELQKMQLEAIREANGFTLVADDVSQVHDLLAEIQP